MRFRFLLDDIAIRAVCGMVARAGEIRFAGQRIDQRSGEQRLAHPIVHPDQEHPPGRGEQRPCHRMRRATQSDRSLSAGSRRRHARATRPS